MMPFHELFPEIGLSETGSARVLQNDEKLPADSYGFVELFCVDPRCDCRRVMINVLSEDRPAHLATINHAFEPPGPDAQSIPTRRASAAAGRNTSGVATISGTFNRD